MTDLQAEFARILQQCIDDAELQPMSLDEWAWSIRLMPAVPYTDEVFSPIC